ncbi:MAG: hypothetical protein KDC46_01265 [Thermoleophilia bacterium]|nr:hypothetical protein [Thermoleophilia bacterium]
MPDALLDAAGWIALGCGIGALLVLAYMGWRTRQDWRRVRLTQQAAVALVDVHADRVLASIDEANERVGRVADDGEQLAESLAQLRGDVSRLKWLLEQVPQERARLKRAIGDLLLPTDDTRRKGDDDAP